MNYGFDIDDSGKTSCSVKQWSSLGITAGILLFSYGTEPTATAVLRVGKEKALQMAERSLMAQFEKICASQGADDLRYAAMKISDTLRECNRSLYELSTYIGQGIYLGGVIAYCVDDQYIIFPFGGGRAYTWNGVLLMLQGDPAPADGIIRDAIGAKQKWSGQCWAGTLPENGRLILATDVLPSISFKDIFPDFKTAGHCNTTAMLLRRELGKYHSDLSAVLELNNIGA